MLGTEPGTFCRQSRDSSAEPWLSLKLVDWVVTKLYSLDQFAHTLNCNALAELPYSTENDSLTGNLYPLKQKQKGYRHS